MQRIRSVDALRGLIMIIMALDHTRDFFHNGAMSFRPENLELTNGMLFFTRWITHLCAPVFTFTAGIGIFFLLNRGRTASEVSRFLISRGLWLMLLELTAVRLALNFSMTKGPLILTVLWELGLSMIVLAALIHLPVRVLGIISIAGIALHNLLDGITAAQFGPWAGLWNILHQLGVFQVAGIQVVTPYPLIPWVFVMSAGFCFGRILLLEPAERQRWFIRLGLAFTAAFFILRGINIYGDPVPWSTQIPGTAIMSFFRANKYPPSLAYLLMTLGPALLILAGLDRIRMGDRNPLIVFGRVPLLYFIGHLFVIHGLTYPLAWIRYGEVGFLSNAVPSAGGDPKLYPPNYGYDLFGMYLVWIAVVLIMYPLCLWFAGVKARRKDWWLSYL